MRKSKSTLPWLSTIVLLAGALSTGCNGSSTPNPPAASGGPSAGPIIDIDTSTGTVKYRITPAGEYNNKQVEKGTEADRIHGSFAHYVDSSQPNSFMRLAKLDDPKTMYKENKLRLEFDDGSYVTAEPDMSTKRLTWTCYDSSNTPTPLRPANSEAEPFFVPECMYDKKAKDSVIKDDGGRSGVWFHIEQYL